MDEEKYSFVYFLLDIQVVGVNVLNICCYKI